MITEQEDAFYKGLVGAEKLAATQPIPPATPVVTPPAVAKPVTYKNLFSHTETHPVVLDFALLKQFQLEWVDWLPETLFREIELTFKTSIAEVNRLKIMAIQNLHVTDAFWNDWAVFEKVIASFEGFAPQPTNMQPPELGSLFAGVDIANTIRAEKFGDEVCRYIAACFLSHDVTYAPAPLGCAQKFITQIKYVCKDCGNTGSVSPPFAECCASCTHQYDSEHSFSLKPDAALLAKGVGKNLEYKATYDPEAAGVVARFKQLVGLPVDQLKESIREDACDIEAARLIIATDFMKFRTKQLHEQLTSLGPWLGAPT